MVGEVQIRKNWNLLRAAQRRGRNCVTQLVACDIQLFPLSIGPVSCAAGGSARLGAVAIIISDHGKVDQLCHLCLVVVSLFLTDLSFCVNGWSLLVSLQLFIVDSDATNLPSLVVFDLDACLWDPEMYQMRAGSPFRCAQLDGSRIGATECSKIKVLSASVVDHM